MIIKKTVVVIRTVEITIDTDKFTQEPSFGSTSKSISIGLAKKIACDDEYLAYFDGISALPAKDKSSGDFQATYKLTDVIASVD